MNFWIKSYEFQLFATSFQILCNGPGTCIPLCAAAFLLKVSNLSLCEWKQPYSCTMNQIICSIKNTINSFSADSKIKSSEMDFAQNDYLCCVWFDLDFVGIND